MARVICFQDGSTEVLLGDGLDTEARKTDLEKILQERLGNDFIELFRERYREEKEEQAGYDYELACDEYRTCLQDALDELRHVLNLLEEPRLNRRKLTSVIERIAKSINNEL